MKKKWIFTSVITAFACTAIGCITLFNDKLSVHAQTETIETAVIKELEDITGQEVFTKESNGRILGDFDDNKNRALSMQIDLSSNTGYNGAGGSPTLGLSFFGPTTNETHAGNGHIGELNYQFIMDGRTTQEYPNGSMSLVYHDGVEVQYVTVAQPECVYNKETIDFEFGSCAIKTGTEWTGNYLYVKINDAKVLETRDTGTYFNTKSTCVSISESAFGYYNNSTVFLSNSVTLDTVTVHDYKDLTGREFGEHVSSETATQSDRNIGNLSSNENVSFRTWIKRTGTMGDHWYGGLSILESEYGANDGYYLYCDWDIFLCTKTGESVNDEDDRLSRARNNNVNDRLAVNVGAIGETDGFVVEFGVRNVKKAGVKIGNYVYLTVDGKLIHGYFDNSANFNKTGTGVSITWITNIRNYQFGTVPSDASLTKIRTAYNAIKALPDMTSVALTDKTAIETARTAYDALTTQEKLYVVNETRLLNAERQLWLVEGDAKADDVTVYDLYDINGDTRNAYMTLVTNPDQLAQIQSAVDNGLPFNGRKIGLMQETSNVAFKTRISYEWYVQNSLFLELYIMQKAVTSTATNYGYRLYWKDGNIELQYDKNPLVLGDGDNTVGARLASADVTAIVGQDIQNADEEFILEFGCAKYIAYDVWQGNYVYLKVNNQEILSFVDSGAFFKDKGKIVANGNYNTWHLYTFNSLYDFVDITMGEVPEGGAFSQGETQKVPLSTRSKLFIPTKYGYEITTATLEGVDVTDKLVLTQDGYALDCSALNSGGVLDVTTARKQVNVTVVENEKTQVTTIESADILSVMDAKIATANGYILTSFTINGEEYIDEVTLGKDGYYYCNTYRLLTDAEISTAVAEKNYSVDVNKKGAGTVTAVETVGAFGDITVTITPTDGNVIKGVLLNGKAVNVSEDGTIVIKRVTEDLFFDVRFTEKPLAVDTTVNTNKIIIVSIVLASLIAVSITVIVIAVRVNKKSNR